MRCRPPFAAGGGVDNVARTLAARAGTSRSVIDRINRELAVVLALPDVQSRFIELGMVARHSTPEALRAMQVSDIKKWGGVMKSAKIEQQ